MSAQLNTRFSSGDLLMAGFIVVVWGMNFVVMKFGLREFTPFQLGAARFALASLPFMLFIARPGLPWRLLLLYGTLQGVGQFGFLFTALKVGMTASLASVLMQTQVFFTAMLGVYLLGERIGPAQRLGMALAAFAMVCFTMHFVATNPINTVTHGLNHMKNGISVAANVTALGFLLTLAAAASWAGANVVARRAQAANANYDPLQFVVWTSAVPVLPLLAMSAIADSSEQHANWLNASATAWAAAAYLALIATVWAYTLWTKLLKRHAASKVSPFGLAVPVVGLTAGTLLLGETVSTWQWAGVVCIALALLATVFGSKYLVRMRDEPR